MPALACALAISVSAFTHLIIGSGNVLSHAKDFSSLMDHAIRKAWSNVAAASFANPAFACASAMDVTIPARPIAQNLADCASCADRRKVAFDSAIMPAWACDSAT